MKRPVLRHWLDRVVVLQRRPKRPGPPPSLGSETRTGASIGCAACLLFATVAGGGAIVLFWSGVSGLLTGSAIGLLLWAGADGHEEQQVLPPQRSRWMVQQVVPPPHAERRHPGSRPPSVAGNLEGAAMPTRVQIVFYSMYGHIYRMAEAVAKGAGQAPDVEVTLLQVPELVPEAALERTGAQAARQAFAHVPQARPEQLAEADAIIFGTPTRFGNMCAQMRNFLDQTGGLWAKGALVGKLGSVFTSTGTQHGGQETTLVSFHTTLLHLGMLVVGVPYAEARLQNMDEISGGTPYGASTLAGSRARTNWRSPATRGCTSRNWRRAWPARPETGAHSPGAGTPVAAGGLAFGRVACPVAAGHRPEHEICAIFPVDRRQVPAAGIRVAAGRRPAGCPQPVARKDGGSR